MILTNLKSKSKKIIVTLTDLYDNAINVKNELILNKLLHTTSLFNVIEPPL
jgi:hypothetical protein